MSERPVDLGGAHMTLRAVWSQAYMKVPTQNGMGVCEGNGELKLEERIWRAKEGEGRVARGHFGHKYTAWQGT